MSELRAKLTEPARLDATVAKPAAQHTSGEWMLRSTGDGWSVETDDADIAHVYDYDGELRAESYANACLIAAGKTMYAYLDRRAAAGDAEAERIIEAIHAGRSQL